MNLYKLYIIASFFALISINSQSQDSIRNNILADLQKHDYPKCIERIEMIKSMKYNYGILTFNEYWAINLICNRYVPIEEYKYRFNPFGNLDTLSMFLLLEVIEKKEFYTQRIDSLYKLKDENTLSKLYFNLLVAKQQDSFLDFKHEKRTIVKRIKHNVSEYPDSTYNLIKGVNVKKHVGGVSFEGKSFINHNASYISGDMSFLSFGMATYRTRFGWLETESSFDFNLINPSIKIGIGYTWAMGAQIYGNHKFKTSLLAFMSTTYLSKTEAFGSVGLKLNSIIYLQKEKAKFNINSSDVSRDHIKLTLGYSYLENAQFIIGLGTGFSFIRHFKRPKFNF